MERLRPVLSGLLTTTVHNSIYLAMWLYTRLTEERYRISWPASDGTTMKAETYISSATLLQLDGLGWALRTMHPSRRIVHGELSNAQVPRGGSRICHSDSYVVLPRIVVQGLKAVVLSRIAAPARRLTTPARLMLKCLTFSGV